MVYFWYCVLYINLYIKKFKVDLRNFFYGDKIDKCYKI